MTAGNRRVLVIAAHPDDADFLAGGTVARLAEEGRAIAYVVVTNGSKGIG
jgi:LmbE family N-acetylglucosaminyl deacetylase